MTEAVLSTLSGPRSRPARVVALVCSAHFVSHVYLIALPPLFALIRREYGVSYSELGLLMAGFNIVTTGLQAPAGIFVDRRAPGLALILALVLGAAGMALAGFIPAFWALVAGWGVVAVANTIYHPADYALLSDTIGAKRIGHVFALHTFFGMAGTAVAPVSILFLAERFGWRGGLLGCAALGVAAALLLAAGRSVFPDRGGLRAQPGGATDWTLMLSPAILRNVMFFILLSAASAGISSFSVVALGAFQGTSLAAGNAALSTFLALNAAGTLAGGFLASHTRRHDRIALLLLAAGSAAILAIALLPLRIAPLVALMAAAGFFNGAVQPQRDMMVRAVTPEGSFGKVFGFVSMGFGVGGMIGSLTYGFLMDWGAPRFVFLGAVAFTALAMAFVRVPPAGTGRP